MLHLGKHASEVKNNKNVNIAKYSSVTMCNSCENRANLLHFWNHELELGKLQDHVHLALLGSNALLCKNLLQSCYLREKGLIGTLICLFFYPSGSTTHIPLYSLKQCLSGY